MPTKLIGIKEFRAHMSEYAQEARKKKVRFIVMNRNNPMFEIRPFAENEGLEEIFADITKAQEDIKKGNLHTQDGILKEFS